MTKNTEMVSLTDALRDGASPEDIRKSFEAALKDAQNEVAAEQAKAKASEDECSEDCENCPGCGEIDLDEAREDAIYAILDYLYALGIIPEDMEIDEDDVESLIEAVKEIEDEYKARISFMKMIAAIAKMEAGKSEEKPKAKSMPKSDKDAADAIIKKFLEGLR